MTTKYLVNFQWRINRRLLSHNVNIKKKDQDTFDIRLTLLSKPMTRSMKMINWASWIATLW